MELRDHKNEERSYWWYVREIIPKICGTKIRQNGGFSELVFLVDKENGGISEVDGYCTYTPSSDERFIFSSGHERKCRRMAGFFAYFCVYAGRTNPRAGHRAGRARVRSRQAGTVVSEEANETARLVSIKGPRSAESTRNPSPATRPFVTAAR